MQKLFVAVGFLMLSGLAMPIVSAQYGLVHNGHLHTGYAPGGYVQGGYVQGGFVQPAYPQSSYVQNGYVQGGYTPNTVYRPATTVFQPGVVTYPSTGYYPATPTFHNTSHYDYHNPTVVPHNGHLDVLPGHYDYHQSGHFHP